MRSRLASIDAGGGLSVLLLGAALLVAGVLFDAEPLLVPGLALLGLSAAAAGWVAIGAAGGSVERRLDATRVVEGEPLRAHLVVSGGPLGLAGATLEDPLLGGPQPLAVDARVERLRVEARFARRGRRELAAPALVVGDPLGLISVRRTAPEAAASVLVLPRVEPVVVARGAGGDGTGLGVRRAVTAAAEIELDGLRPMRPGAAASRIHWPALARGAGLLERRLLPESDARPLVVLDPRHATSLDALDAAVRATASLAVHLARRGACGVLLPGDARPSPLEAQLQGWAALHVRLALLDGEGAPALAALAGRRGPVLLVMAHTPGRPPRVLVAAASARRVLVVPGAMADRRAVFTVAGCTGYELTRVRARTPAGTEAGR